MIDIVVCLHSYMRDQVTPTRGLRRLHMVSPPVEDALDHLVNI